MILFIQFLFICRMNKVHTFLQRSHILRRVHNAHAQYIRRDFSHTHFVHGSHTVCILETSFSLQKQSRNTPIFGIYYFKNFPKKTCTFNGSFHMHMNGQLPIHSYYQFYSSAHLLFRNVPFSRSTDNRQTQRIGHFYYYLFFFTNLENGKSYLYHLFLRKRQAHFRQHNFICLRHAPI